MARCFTEFPEVAGSRYNAPTKVVLPHAVHDDARGKLVARTRDPVREDGAASGGIWEWLDGRFVGFQKREEAGGDVLFALAGFHENRRSGRADVGCDKRFLERRGFEVIKLFQLGLEFCETFFDRFILDGFCGARLFEADLAVANHHVLLFERGSLWFGFVDDGLEVVVELARGGLGFRGEEGFENFIHFFADAGGGLLPSGLFALVFRLLLRVTQREVVAPFDGGEERAEAVVILLEDGVELVVVAVGASVAQTEEQFPAGVGYVGEDDVPLAGDVALVVFVDGETEVLRSRQDFWVVGGDFIAGELFAHEAVVGFVGVKAFDDPISVRPDVGTVGVLVVAIAFGVTGEVEPMLGPALPVTGGLEESVDEGFVCGGGWVVQEGVDFGGGWGESVEVEGRAPDELLTVCLRGGGEFQLGVFCGDETIDFVFCPCAACFWWNGFSEGFEEPVVALLFGKSALGDDDLFVIDGPRSPEAHPLFEGRDFGVREFVSGRHFEVFVGLANGLDEGRFVGVAGDDGGSGITAGFEVGDVVDAEPPFLFFFAVALETVFRQEGPDFVFEELSRVLPAGGCGDDEGEREEGEGAKVHWQAATGGRFKGADWRERKDSGGIFVSFSLARRRPCAVWMGGVDCLTGGDSLPAGVPEFVL